VFRERVFRYVEEDWSDVLGRASQLWSPRWRSDASSKSAPMGGIDVEFGVAADAAEDCACFSDADAVQVSEHVLAHGEYHLFISCISVTNNAQTITITVWLPGRVLHVYPHRGVYKVCAVPRTFRGLRSISVQGNIFENHKSRAIPTPWNLLSLAVTALACVVVFLYCVVISQVRSVRRSLREAPEWTPFHSTNVCQRCQAAFTWHT
jgi:hypothetical protein